MENKPYHICDRFPEKTDTIALLVSADPEFRAMCSDYDVCVEALEYWIRSEEFEAVARIQEYRDLIRELEAEIAVVLESINPRRRQ